MISCSGPDLNISLNGITSEAKQAITTGCSDYQRFLKQRTLVCSMNVVGHCGDNATCEGFFGILKRGRGFGTGSSGNRDMPRKTPLEILQERYARGEIEREEYEQKRRDLDG